MAEAGARAAFSRFGEKRKVGSDTSGYDEYIEGVEADETASLETPLDEGNLGFKLIQKMGWKSGSGLGKFAQGRVEPVPIEVKEDHMGLGRWSLELELAQDATEKRKQMEVEKKITPDLLQQYQVNAEKEKKLTETLLEMNKSFYCELCDKQYTKYSEYDNHINSYSHHHQQRLKDLKEYETGRKFGGHRRTDEEREKMEAAQLVALERAQMNARRKAKGGFTPAFAPIGSAHRSSSAVSNESAASLTSDTSTSAERAESHAKIEAKKLKLAKFGLKFQSAGTLTSITDELGSVSSTYRSPAIVRRLTGGNRERDEDKSLSEYRLSSFSNDTCSSGDSKFLFGFNKTKLTTLKPVAFESKDQTYTSVWNSLQPGSQIRDTHVEDRLKGPPPLMSRQRELNLEKAFSEESSDDDDVVQKRFVKRAPTKFKFNIRK